MKIHVDGIRRVWLSYEYLKDYGILEKTIEAWKTRNIGIRKYIDNRAFINYDTIPAQTRKRLLPKSVLRVDEKQERRETLQKEFFHELEKAYDGIRAAKWRNEIINLNTSLSKEYINKYARHAAVLERIFEVYKGGRGDLDCLHRAYLQLFPDSYTMKNRFCMMLKQAKENGILSVAVDKRSLREWEPVHGEVAQYWATYILSHNKGYSIKMSHEILQELCDKEGYKAPQLNWLQTFYRENKNLIDRNRLGKNKSDGKNGTYMKITPALYSGDQWQMDGWTLPIFCKKRNEKGGWDYFKRYTLFTVLDTHSRKIIGFDIAESENTETILKGIERSVKNTLTLPYEIVSDNHSFNKTKEAGNLKDEFEKLGVTWNIDSNPRRKAILERTFLTLGDRYYKRHYGYIGQGIKSKIETGITQQELMDIYTKPDNFLSYEQVVAISTSIIDEYNNTKTKTLNDTPCNMYEKSEKPHVIPVDEFQRLVLFVRRAEHKISRGQITIQRGSHRYEYQLSAKYSERYNNQVVGVRYATFDEIYLYEKGTDKPICSVPQKLAIHGALANQTDRDRELLFKNKGRMKGIEIQGKRKKEKMFDVSNTINPDAYERVNKITASKDVLKEIAENKAVRDCLIADFDLNPDNIPPFPVINEMLDASLRPCKKENKHPFDTEKGSMEKLLINI